MSKLSQGVDLTAVVALGLGTAVGVSIFSVIAPATGLAGPGMLISVAIAAVPMFIIAVTYAFMGSALPTSGASYEWPRRFIHPLAGFIVAWLRIAGSVGAMLVLALVMVRYLAMVAPVPTKPTMAAVFLLVFGANVLGVGVAARLQTVLMAALVLLFVVFAVWGAPHIAASHFQPLLPHGGAGVLAAIPLLVGLFFGIEAATEVGEEVKDSATAIPWGIGLSIVSAVGLYLMVGFVALGVLGAAGLSASQTPLLDAAEVFMGPLAKPLVVTAAVVAIGKSLNALFLIFSRNLYAMARAGVLPSSIAWVHPKFGTPVPALALALAACLLGLFLPMTLTALFLAVNIPTLLKYAATSLSAARVITRHPELYAAARFKLRPGAMRVWAYVSMAAALAVIALGITTDWRPYVALLAWLAIGLAYYFIRGRVTPPAALSR
jgi:APA family basic amino acid/polyamine antiporter